MPHVVVDLLGIFYVAPLALAALFKLLTGQTVPDAGSGSHGCLLPPPEIPMARIRIVFGRGRAFRFAFGGHCYIVYKRHGAPSYTRCEYDGRGEPIFCHGWAPNDPQLRLQTFVWGADGALAETLIPRIEAAIAAYGKRHYHDYRRTIGPNSNTFIQGVIDGTPGLHAMLPPQALGKDYPHVGGWLRRTSTGVHVSLGGWLSLRLGWIEGFELGCPIAVAGIDVRRPALKLPAIGRIGMKLCPTPNYVPNSGRLPPVLNTARHRHGGDETELPYRRRRNLR